MNIRWILLPVLMITIFAIVGGCVSQQSPPAAPSPSAPPSPDPAPASSGPLTLHVDALTPGSVLPDRFTCRGAGESPPVSWGGIPEGTKSLVLILDDPDAPAGFFTHWLVYNIPPQSGGIEQGQTYAKTITNGAQQGESSAGSRGYYYPCPPPGSTHHYVFHLYAVDDVLVLPTADRAAIDASLAGHTLAKTEFVTIFSR